MVNEKRLIDANLLGVAFGNAIKRCRTDLIRSIYIVALKAVNDCPTVDAVEVVHGHWVYYSTTMQECSNCKRHTARHKFNYCPHCGAVMEDRYYE